MKHSKPEGLPFEGPIRLGHISIDLKQFKEAPDLDDIPVLPTRNLVLFPGVHLSLGLGRENSVRVAEYSESHTTPVLIVCQTDPKVDNPRLSDLNKYGVVADVLKVIELPDGSKTALVRARQKCRITGAGTSRHLPGVLSARISISKETGAKENDPEFKALIENILEILSELENKSIDGASFAMPIDTPEPVELVNTVATNTPLDVQLKFDMLKARSIKARAWLLLDALQLRSNMLDVRNEVLNRARGGIEDSQRTVFLQQQMEAIRQELYGDESDDIENFIKRANQINMTEEMSKVFQKEIDKLRRLNPQTPDYAVQYGYVDTLLSLPWDKSTPVQRDLKFAERVLEEDHYGLEKVKERIIEQVALIMDNAKAKSPIICLVGPPGVGKTSLGASIARALGRNYQRVALGGLHDEAEIRGHRRTYIGAMPGRIIDAVKRAGTNNPVLLLDEIDKIGADYKGDPAAALLEVLDPEQNCHFHDNFIDVDFDLSNVLFIATANTLDTVSRPLLDRIEVIEIPGYLPQEKIEIAARHLLPRLIYNQGWRNGSVKVSDEALQIMIDEYTSESGVRQLEKLLGKIMRKAVLYYFRDKKFPKPVRPQHLQELLGTPPHHRERPDAVPLPGVVTGLAWTQAGGETLLVEVSLAPAKTADGGGKLTLTGNLGNVMKESATIAQQWVKAHAAKLGIAADRINGLDVHIHFPEGAIPKDGPSAGITITTALVSAYLEKPVRPHLAMTGEATLRGRVLPVGGIREKLLAAHRAGVTDIIVCNENRRDVADIPAEYLQGLTRHDVDTLDEVLQTAFEHSES